tara:strand:- start:98459 stop:98569 length:111 start_codon:yes stop_codon:yes gene_type:complete
MPLINSEGTTRSKAKRVLMIFKEGFIDGRKITYILP